MRTIFVISCLLTVAAISGGEFTNTYRTFVILLISRIAPMRLRTIAPLLALSAFAGIATAGEIKPFSQAEFDQLTKAGQPVIVDVSATWCPTCKAQKPIIEKLMQQPAYKDVTLLSVDFDKEKDTVRAFKVSMQSTLVGFKGTQEVARSVGDTTEAGLEGLVQKTLR